MRTLKLVSTIIMVLACQSALADSAPLNAPGPLGDLQAQIEALNDRIETLETNAPTSIVDGRSYCAMVDVTVQRGWSNTGTEETQTVVFRRLATFSGGAFMATTTDGLDINQDDSGVVSGALVAPGAVLAGVYTQTGQRLDVTFDTGETRVWYVSADGSVIHNNSADHFGPFPINTLSVGVIRSATFIESDTCDDV